jgi:NADH:ubiquinone oxidoreductase subunit 5 (subunit L)/multisubunit Na+/H+ antiporter MnhA subunit
MAPKLPRRPYVALVIGLLVIAFLAWSTVREFETGTIPFKRVHIYEADDPIGFWLRFSLFIFVILCLVIAWCVLIVRIWRGRRERIPPSKRQK